MLEPREWRVSRVGRAAGWLFVAMGIAGATAGLIGIPLFLPVRQWWARVPVLAMCAAGAFAGYRFGVLPSIALTATGIRVRNPLRRHEIAWRDIDVVGPTYYGLRIKRVDGRPITAWAVQKSNWSRWTKRTTRADEVADELNRASRAGRGIHLPL